MSDRSISVVIPAYHEEARIGAAVRSVHAFVPAPYLRDVVVVDHGSRDRTVACAEEAGARVLVFRDGTIAEQRNRGAAATSGAYLLFLDADVTLTAAWRDALDNVLAALEAAPMTITGSHTIPPPDGNPFERHWFAHIAAIGPAKHLGSAHMLMARVCFDAVGGFDASLVTGEDFEFCVRAARRGAAVVNDARLVAVHHDFPSSIAAFVRREAWHGRGNFASLAMALSSPVSVATLAFAGLHLSLPVAAAVRPRLALAPALGILGICAGSSFVKFRRAPLRSRIVNTGIYYLYFSGRSLALVRAIRERLGAKHGVADHRR